MAFLDDDRGQTVLDYAVAAGIFFVALTFVLSFIPGMFAPFTGAQSAQDADRYATSLATDRLGNPETPYVLNETCTWKFFDQLREDNATGTGCRFDTTATSLDAMFATGPGVSVNVTVETLDGDVAELTRYGKTRRLAAGDPVPGNRGVTTARRVVSLKGRAHRLLVRVW